MDTRIKRSKFTAPALALAAFAPLIIGCVSCTAPQETKTTQEVPAPPDRARARVRAAITTDITVLHTALDAFALNNAGRYPDSLSLLVTPDATGHRYLNVTQVPRDPWGREYGYVAGPPPVVTTFGADGRPGGTGENADVDSASIAHMR